MCFFLTRIENYLWPTFFTRSKQLDVDLLRGSCVVLVLCIRVCRHCMNYYSVFQRSCCCYCRRHSTRRTGGAQSTFLPEGTGRKSDERFKLYRGCPNRQWKNARCPCHCEGYYTILSCLSQKLGERPVAGIQYWLLCSKFDANPYWCRCCWVLLSLMLRYCLIFWFMLFTLECGFTWITGLQLMAFR